MKNLFFLENQQEIEMNMIRLQKSLDEKSRDYKEIMSSIPGGVCKILCDNDLTILYANKFFYQMLGYQKESAKKDGFFSLRRVMCDEDVEYVKTQLKSNFDAHIYKVEVEVRHITKEGNSIWVLACCVYNEGMPGAFTCVCIDITERKNFAEELRIREEEYRIAIQNHTDKIILRYDLNNHVLTCPKWAANLLGIPQVMENIPYSMIEQNYMAQESHEEYVDFYNSMVKGVPQGNAVFKMCNRRWYRADYTLLYDENRKPIRSIISYEDITEQREKAFAYEKWRQNTASLLEQDVTYYEYNVTKDLVDRIDASLLVALPSEVNKSFSALIRYVANHFIYELDREKYLRFFSREILLSRYYLDKKEFYLEYRRLNSKGEPYWVSTANQLLPDPYSNDVKLLVLMQDIDAKKKQEEELQLLSQKDTLTGLLNRRTIIDKIDGLLNGKENNNKYVLIIIDMDHFKVLNDTLGHLYGDQVLIDIGKTLCQMVDESALVGRLGNDEFVVFVQYHTSIAVMEKKIEQICRALEKSFERNVSITGSIGVALAPRDGMSFISLYPKAELALYQAKNYGRNQYVVYKPEMENSRFSLSELAAKEFIKKETLEWNELEKKIFAYYNIVFCSLYDELFEFNLTKNTYRMIYHLPNKYLTPPNKGVLSDFLSTFSLDLVYSEDSERFQSFFSLENMSNHLKTTHFVIEENFRKMRKNGEYKWIRASLVPFVDENGDEIFLCCIMDIDAQKQAEVKARCNYVDKDPLTGYFSFERFRAECEVLLHDQGDKKYALWLCDVKNFKFINDIYGYEFGDRILRYWAKIIDEGLEDGEAFARKSADHFVVLRKYESNDDFERRFDRSVNLLKNYREFVAKKFRVDISAGIYLIERSEDILPMEDMLDRASIAQKKAKKENGSHLAVYNVDMRNRIIYEKELEADMYWALSEKEFRVYLQPQVAIHQCNKVVGAEALVRWVKNDDSVIGPVEFIPMFEKNGFIVRLDRFVFEEVCAYMRQRIRSGKYIFRIAVNVSRISAFQSDFAETYIKIKEKYGIPDGLLELEFTETVVVENVEQLDNIMQMMRPKGFVFSLDDFGSGYSSLNMLKNIVVDVIKLDMMFFQGSVDIQREEIIVGSVIDMAKALHMTVVSEGVETEEQLERLKRLGCDIVQGYYFGRPVPKDEFDFTYQRLLNYYDMSRD